MAPLREAFWAYVDAGGRKANPFWPSVLSVVLFAIETAFDFRPA